MVQGRPDDPAKPELLELRLRALRNKILLDHLKRLALPGSASDDVAESVGERLGRAYAREAIRQSLSGDVQDTIEREETDEDLFHRLSRLGLSLKDVDTETQSSSTVFDIGEALSASLKETLARTADFHICDPSLSSEELQARCCRLADEIREDQRVYQEKLNQLHAMQERIVKLVEMANTLQNQYREALIHQATTVPPLLQAEASASDDLAALTIETSLLKLSLLRARASSALYGYQSSGDPRLSLSKALSHLAASLEREQAAVEAEHGVYKKKLREYAKVVAIVGGQQGDYAQIVEDWNSITKETEECRRDLRRLGFSEHSSSNT